MTLVELVIIIVIIGIIAAIAAGNLGESIETAKFEQTRNEMDQLAAAIVGNPEAYTAGARSDFGYVGDVGALPDSLGALVVNPGGYLTWNGPYIVRGSDPDDFRTDAWISPYVLVDTMIRSTGSGSPLDKVFAVSSSSLLNNTVSGRIVDADREPPGYLRRDSVMAELVYPDGTGGVATAQQLPDEHGRFSFAGIPIGNHRLRVIYLPSADTLVQLVSIMPGSTAKIEVVYPLDLW
jgi:type II secretory pathway pseudopilin PulG